MSVAVCLLVSVAVESSEGAIARHGDEVLASLLSTSLGGRSGELEGRGGREGTQLFRSGSLSRGQ